MSNPCLPHATIITLDYAPNHLEFSVILHQPERNQLVDLLKDPETYLGQMGEKWNQKGIQKQVPWALTPPCVAILQPLIDRPDLAPSLAHAYGHRSIPRHKL